jgi:hypothetical protein
MTFEDPTPNIGPEFSDRGDIMLVYDDVIRIFDQLKIEMKVQTDALLQFIEKRNIESSSEDSIAPFGFKEPVLISDDCDDQEQQQSNVMVDEPILIPKLTEIVVWIGYFTSGPFFWELAIDMDGTLVRVRKSR